MMTASPHAAMNVARIEIPNVRGMLLAAAISSVMPVRPCQVDVKTRPYQRSRQKTGAGGSNDGQPVHFEEVREGVHERSGVVGDGVSLAHHGAYPKFTMRTPAGLRLHFRLLRVPQTTKWLTLGEPP